MLKQSLAYSGINCRDLNSISLKSYGGPNLSVSQGFNATLTEPVDTQGRRIDQFKEMELKLHQDLREPLRRLCEDPKTTIIVLSGSDRNVLDEVFVFT